MAGICRCRVAGTCDCGREVATWVPRQPQQIAGRTVRVACAHCGAVVHARGDAPGVEA